MLSRLMSFAIDRRGATAVEYGLILSLIVIVLLVALANMANVTIDIWNNVATKVVNAR